MKRLKPSRTTQVSFWIHALVFGVMAIWVYRFPHPLPESSPIEIELLAKKDSLPLVSPQKKTASVDKALHSAHLAYSANDKKIASAKNFDLRPS
jgi:hypothetical protein